MRKLLLILLIISIIVVGVLRFRGGYSPNSGSRSSNQISPPTSLSDHFKKKISFNVLLLGYAGGNHDGTFLTDTMMVAQVDPSSKTVSLVSVPRDLWVKIPTRGDDGGYWKINAAYVLGMDDKGYPQKSANFKGPSGPGNLVKFVVGEITGLTINRFVAVDFNGFKKMIDALGGVNVKVEKAFDDFEYPVEGKESDLCGKTESDLPELVKIATVSASAAFPCRFENLHFDSGVMAMNGEVALKFVRSRHSSQDGSDFSRSIRQKNLLLAVKDKVLSLGFIPKMPLFVRDLQGSYHTDFSPSDLTTLLQHASEMGGYEIKNFALTTDNFLKAQILPDGQYVLVPQEGMNDWNQVHRGLQVLLDPKSRLSFPIVRIESGTGESNLVPLAAGRLRAQGFVTLVPTTTFLPKNRDQILEKTEISLSSPKIDQKLVRKIQNALETGEVHPGSISDPSYDVLVTLGRDFLLKTTSP